jgi:uncharacterized protein (UPF0332 family)
MLDENIINEAEKNFRKYLNDNLIKKITIIDKNIVNILLINAQESIDVAEITNKNKISSMWTIVCSYYSMFYTANCLLYVYGYKVGNKIAHKITLDSLIYLMRDKIKNHFIEIYKEIEEDVENFAQIKSDSLIENLNFERKKRSIIQYQTPEKIKLSKAQTSLKRAKEFLFELRELIEEKI